MIFFETRQLSEISADLMGLGHGCACRFDCQLTDMNLVKNSFHYRPTHSLEGNDMR